MKIRRLCKSIPLACLAIILLAGSVIAQDYFASISFNETSGNSYVIFPAQTPLNTTFLVSEGYITATGLDTRVNTDGDSVPHMLADDKLLFAYPLPANSSNPLFFYTGEAALADYNIISGYDGFVTYADAAALEPGNNYNFTLEDTYVDVTERIDRAFLSKDQAVGIAVTEAGTVTTWISQHALQIAQAAGAVPAVVWGANWYAQTFTPAADMVIQRVEIFIALAAGVPAGDFTVSLRNVAGGIPTGVDLTYDTVDAAGMAPGWNSFYFNVAWPLTNGVTYAIVARNPSGDALNAWEWRFSVANPYAGGQYCNSADSGASWAGVAANDFQFRIYSCTGVSVTGITSGEYDVIASADAVNLQIAVGATTNSVALAGATVPNNANNWILGQNIGYIGDFQHTVAGALIVHYDPTSYIVGTTLPDLQGAAQDGTFTWGSNPAGVSITMGSLSAIDVGVVDEGVVETPDVGGDVGQPEDTYLSDTGMEGTNQLFYFFVSDIAGLTDTPIQYIWWLLIAIFMVIAMTAAAMYFNNMGYIGFAGLAIIGVALGMTLLPGWVLITAILVVAGLVILEKTPAI